ncbi:polyketide synthase [Artomyces pyxidatus]|uniref:Polyketide synthase n=1 Tax=Artomyces pyxidatus TaxID=48021 RepID=A0ACB8SWM2_9AGAM|nr:polyketide synthase [Artomyces pyxidatus]
MSSTNTSHREIAIVGIAAELPSGHWSSTNLNYDSFFQFLLESGEAYETIPAERFNIMALKGHGVGQVLSDTGTFLKNLKLFDYLEFGITSKDARAMSLSTRKLIELSFLSLVDSGIDYRGRNVGCYMSGVAHDIYAVSGQDDAEAKGSFASAPSMLANRVSYHLDLRGPSIPIDTACSSTLFATHLAVQALRNGECDAALIGGCQINHRFAEWLFYTQGGVLSPDGKCKSFDASANGFGRGEGAVAMVLKPMDEALADGDKIYASILGTGVNSSGALAPVNAPVAIAQQDAMTRAFKSAQRDPKEVDFIELHATGTAQGDPTEANWVGAQFKRDDELIIGSVKGNIGHLEITAFLASLCKVCSILETGIIPPNVNFNTPNPAIHWEEYGLRVPVEATKLPCRSPSGRSLVAMTSSGIGGANGHCVVESAPRLASVQASFWTDDTKAPALLIAGGLSPRSATAVCESLMSAALRLDTRIIARIFGRRARSMTWRGFSIVSDGEVPPFTEPVLAPKIAPTTVFVFSGQGPQHVDMGRELFKTCSAFRASVLEMDALHRTVTGVSLIDDIGLFDDLAPPSPVLGGIWPISITLPALTILQIALVDTLASAGIRPDAVVGHSAGETAVLYASGAAPKAMAVELAIARGKAMALLQSANGTMAALSCSPAVATKLVTEVIEESGTGALDIGCHNSTDSVTLSGAGTSIDRAIEKAEAAGIFARKLRTSVPVHSSMMDLCRFKFKTLVAEVFSRYNATSPTIQTYSTKTGNLFDEVFDADYFWDGTRGPVLFTEAINSLLSDHPTPLFCEIGPHPVLSGYLTSLSDKKSTVICPMKRPKTGDVARETIEILDSIGRMFVAGNHSLDFDTIYGNFRDSTDASQLPPFPFARRDVPYLAQTPEVARQHQRRYGPLNCPQLQINSASHPGLADHVIQGEPIMPASGYVEMVLEYGARKLWNVEFLSILPLSSERPIPVKMIQEGSSWKVCSASSTDYSLNWPMQYTRLHSKGIFATNADPRDSKRVLPISEIRNRLMSVDINGLYAGFRSFAQYGASYQRIVSCRRGSDALGRDELLVELRGADEDLPDIAVYKLHPAVLDAALHVIVHPTIAGSRDPEYFFLPSKIGTAIVHDTLMDGPVPSIVYAHAVSCAWTPEYVIYNVTILDAQGTALFTMEDLEFARHGKPTQRVVKGRYTLDYEPTSLLLTRVQDEASSSSNLRICLVDSTETNRGAGNTSLAPAITSTPHRAKPTILHYLRGGEMNIQEQVLSFNALAEMSLWFVASSGLDGAALLGFARSFRREYRLWTVGSIVFDGTWSTEEMIKAAEAISGQIDISELELSVDADGSVFVPRIVPAPTPQTQATFDPEKPWTHSKANIRQCAMPAAGDDQVCVHVAGVTELQGQLWGFIGFVDGSARPVLGISPGSLSNFIIVHRGSLAEFPLEIKSDDPVFGPPLLATVIGILGIGYHSFSHLDRLQHSVILVTHSDTLVGAQVVDFYKGLGLQVVTLPSQPSLFELKQVSSRRPNLAVSGHETSGDVETLKTVLAPHARLFLWNDTATGISSILAEDPWLVGDVLRLGLNTESMDVLIPFRHPLDIVDAVPEMVDVVELFSHEKIYLLVGGVGTLGIQIAWWMYRMGARNIVLTSRSGRDGITRRGDRSSLLLLDYLETVTDLSMRTEAVDATSTTSMASLIRSLDGPLGGCMLLVATATDRTFASQDPESFESPYSAKIGAFKTLQDVISIQSLDFMIAFSSVSGMFGNAGQTNYASANTALAELTRSYKNALTLVCPVILDVEQVLGVNVDTSTYTSRLKHFINWGFTVRELCDCLRDGILLLRESLISTYIPNFDWDLVQANMGNSPMYSHLASGEDLQANGAGDTGPSTLSKIVSKVLDIAEADLSPDVPLTTYGLDSLSAASLSYALRPLFVVSQLQLLADLSLRQLQERLDASAQIVTSAQGIQSTDIAVKARDMIDMVDKYTTNLSMRKPILKAEASMQRTVLLTGATGSLGAHVLARLLQSESIDHVYVLVRQRLSDENDTFARLHSAFISRGLEASLLDDCRRLTVLPSTGVGLDLSSEILDKLRAHVTDIIDLAWNVDFGVPLAEFEPAIRTVRELVDLALSSEQQSLPKLLFCSTAGVYRGAHSSALHPEAPITDPTVSIGAGYIESKWVAERLLSVVRERTALRPTVVRVGQLSGGVNGAWKTTEWVPAMISGSLAMGCLPDGVDDVSWLPVDIAAAAMIDMLYTPTPEVLHLCHPSPIPWNQMMEFFASSLHLPIVPYPDWLSLLESGFLASSSSSGAVPLLQPALRLLEFFSHVQAWMSGSSNPARLESNGLVPRLAMEEGLRISATLDKTLPQLRESDVAQWLAYWRSVGFIPQ